MILEGAKKGTNPSSMLGTVKYANEKNNLFPLSEKSVYLDLATDAMFSELFIENMTFEEICCIYQECIFDNDIPL